jgi:hypothetical protein
MAISQAEHTRTLNMLVARKGLSPAVFLPSNSAVQGYNYNIFV